MDTGTLDVVPNEHITHVFYLLIRKIAKTEYSGEYVLH